MRHMGIDLEARSRENGLLTKGLSMEAVEGGGTQWKKKKTAINRISDASDRYGDNFWTSCPDMA